MKTEASGSESAKEGSEQVDRMDGSSPDRSSGRSGPNAPGATYLRLRPRYRSSARRGEIASHRLALNRDRPRSSRQHTTSWWQWQRTVSPLLYGEFLVAVLSAATEHRPRYQAESIRGGPFPRFPTAEQEGPHRFSGEGAKGRAV